MDSESDSEFRLDSKLKLDSELKIGLESYIEPNGQYGGQNDNKDDTNNDAYDYDKEIDENQDGIIEFEEGMDMDDGLEMDDFINDENDEMNIDEIEKVYKDEDVAPDDDVLQTSTFNSTSIK